MATRDEGVATVETPCTAARAGAVPETVAVVVAVSSVSTPLSLLAESEATSGTTVATGKAGCSITAGTTGTFGLGGGVD